MHRRSVIIVAGWLVGTALVVGVGIQAVSVVTESVTEARPAPLSAAAVNNALVEDGGAGGGPGPSDPGPVPGATATTVTTRPATASPTRPGGSTATTATTATTAATATTAPPAATVTTSPGSDDGSETGTTAPPATSPPTAAEDRTYDLVGGSVGVRFENGAARLLWATPAAGFRVERSGGTDSGEVEVRFRSDSHESRLRAFWDDGPQAEIEEKAD